MTEVPSWWVWVSAVFFISNTFLFIALAVAVLRVSRLLKELQPKIEGLIVKGHELTNQVSEISHKVSDLATAIKENVNQVGGRAKGVVGSAELVAQSASKQFERFSPFVVGTLTAFRLIKALNEMRHGASPAQATKKGVLERIPFRKKKQKPSLWSVLRGK